MKNLGQRTDDLDIVVKKDLPVIEIGGSTSGTATDIVALGSGHYVWKAGTYIKIKSYTYQNIEPSLDIPIEFFDNGSSYIIIAQYFMGSNSTVITSYPVINSFNRSTGARVKQTPMLRGLVNSSDAILDIYAPTTAGTNGYILKSNGFGK